MIPIRLFNFARRPQSIHVSVRVLWTMNPYQVNSQTRNYANEKCYEEKDYDEYIASLIGNREQVGYGRNGQPFYDDRSDFPFSAIRYKEPTAEIMALREKERGDWRLLTIGDKKELYRASFCQTFAEFQFVSSQWMAIVGWVLIFLSAGLWMFTFMHYFVYNPRPKTFQPEYRRAALKRMIDLHVEPIHGLTSYWDYEKKRWKRNSFFFPLPPNPYLDDCQEEEEENLESAK